MTRQINKSISITNSISKIVCQISKKRSNVARLTAILLNGFAVKKLMLISPVQSAVKATKCAVCAGFKKPIRAIIRQTHKQTALSHVELRVKSKTDLV